MGLYEQDCPTSETPPAVPSGLRSDEVVSMGTQIMCDSSLVGSPQGDTKTYHFLLRSPCGNNPHKMRIEVTNDISASMSESERKKFLLQLQICAISACPRSVNFREKTEKLWFYTCDVHRCLDKRSAAEHISCFDPIMSRCSVSGKYLLEIPEEKDPHWILRLSDRDQTYRGKHPPTTHVTRSRDILEAPSKPIFLGQKEYDDACCWHANAIEFREPRKDLQTLLASLSAIKFAGDMSDTDSFAFTFETARTRVRNGVKTPECAEQPVSSSEMRSATQTALERLGRVDKLRQSSQAYTGAERMLSAWENLAKASDRASITQCVEELNGAPKPPRSSRRYAQRDRWYGFNESAEQEVLLALKSSRDEVGHIVNRLEDSTELAFTGQDTVERCKQHAHGTDQGDELSLIVDRLERCAELASTWQDTLEYCKQFAHGSDEGDELSLIVDRLERCAELASTGQDTVECCKQHAHGTNEGDELSLIVDRLERCAELASTWQDTVEYREQHAHGTDEGDELNHIVDRLERCAELASIWQDIVVYCKQHALGTDERDELGDIIDRLESSEPTELEPTGHDSVECCEQHAHGTDERHDRKHTELCQCKSLITAIDQARLIIPTLSMIYDTHQGILHHSRYHKGKPDPADFTILDKVADVLRKLPEDG